MAVCGNAIPAIIAAARRFTRKQDSRDPDRRRCLGAFITTRFTRSKRRIFHPETAHAA